MYVILFYWCISLKHVESSECKRKFVYISVPVSVVTAEGDPQDTQEVPEELILDDDDSTTRNLERLVSAATCLVAGVEYTHGQQVSKHSKLPYLPF